MAIGRASRTSFDAPRAGASDGISGAVSPPRRMQTRSISALPDTQVVEEGGRTTVQRLVSRVHSVQPPVSQPAFVRAIVENISVGGGCDTETDSGVESTLLMPPSSPTLPPLISPPPAAEAVSFPATPLADTLSFSDFCRFLSSCPLSPRRGVNATYPPLSTIAGNQPERGSVVGLGSPSLHAANEDRKKDSSSDALVPSSLPPSPPSSPRSSPPTVVSSDSDVASGSTLLTQLTLPEANSAASDHALALNADDEFTLVPAGARPVPPLAQELLHGLQHIAYRLRVLGGGRCPLAAFLLALGRLSDDHDDLPSKRQIDQLRRALGKAMSSPRWSEESWLQAVPNDLRSAHTRWSADGSTITQTSHEAYRILLTARPVTEWLDHCVFYLASAQHDVGVLVLTVMAESTTPLVTCRRVGGDASQHVVLVHTVSGLYGHYECVQYGGLRVFPSDHELISRLVLLAESHPPEAMVEDDAERFRLVQSRASTQKAAPAQRVLRSKSSTPLKAKAERGATRSASSPAKTSAKRSPPQPLPKHVHPVHQRPSSILSHTSSNGAPPDLPTVAEMAGHGDLYDFISFTNTPQWIGMCSLVFNAYRVASQDGNRQRQTQAIVDLLMLPQRVLTKLSRAGAGNGKRITRTVKARCHSVGEQLRQQWGCRDPVDHNVKLTVTTMPLINNSISNSSTAETDDDLDTGAEEDYTEAEQQRRPSSPESSSEQQSGDTQPVSKPSSSNVSTIVRTSSTDVDDDDCIDNDQWTHAASSSSTEFAADDTPGRLTTFQELLDIMGEHDPEDDDSKAAKRAKHLVAKGHMKKASQALHSTATMADLTLPSTRQQMEDLHPSLPAGSILPPLPANSHEIILEDDEQMKRVIRSSNNGSASGPSGWGGNMLSSLVEAPICRAGIIALLKDIINGNIPDQARQYLLASRLVGLNKEEGRSGARPIAIGELFYRLAGIVAVRNVVAAAAKLLSPHQYGVGVASGAERIVHSLQHTLSDKSTKLAVLKVDISNAFNSCDRARMLSELYATPQLNQLFRVADFGYSVPSQLLLQRCEGDYILSSNGVRQGDPLSSLLFCVYMRSVYARVAARAKVTLYGFIDDLHVVGTPAEVMKALAALQALLPEVKLQFNTAKSHFAYFHDDAEPLMRSIRETLAAHNIEVHEQWMEVMGAVVGKNEEAVMAGVKAVLGPDHHAAFFRRLRCDVLPVQSAMLLLRQCAVPQLNYLLRCVPPPCVAEEAEQFDATMLTSASDKLALTRMERTAEQHRLLQLKLTDGGFGLTSAVRTSPAAYLGSLAAVKDASAFLPYSSGKSPLPSVSLLHRWIGQSMDQLTAATPSSASILPSSPSSFFSHFANVSSSSASTLQSTLSLQAAEHTHKASLTAARASKKQDGGLALAHALAISAPNACQWKNTLPSSPLMTLTDTQYRIAARLNLRLPPLGTMAALPDDCPNCNLKDAIAQDKWHFLYCRKVQGPRGEVTTRHNAVVDALYHNVLTVGGQAAREPKGLHIGDNRRPDLQIVFPAQHILTDVIISHPLTASYCRSYQALSGNAGVARHAEQVKHRKYRETAKQQEACLLPFSVETCGGMAGDAMKLLKVISTTAAQHLGLWSHFQIVRQLMGSIAVSVQKGNAMTILSGYTSATARAGNSSKAE
jgi:hypothetical protein